MTDRFAFLKRNVEAGGDWEQMETRDALPSAGDELDVPSDVLHEFAIFDQKNGHSTAQYRQGNGIADVFDGAVAAYAAPGASAVNHEGIITARRVADGATRDFSVFDVHSGTLEEWSDGGDVALALNDVSGNGNDTSAATDAEEPLIVKSGVLVSAEERPALTLDGGDDSVTASVSVGDTATVAIDFESAHAATYPATVYSHDGITVRETATDVEVEITDGTNTKTVTEPKLQLNRVVLTATPSNLYVRVNGEESSASHSITRTDNSTLDLGNGSFEGRVGHAVVYDGDRWADRDGLVQGMGGLYSPSPRVRWDFGSDAQILYKTDTFDNSIWNPVYLSLTSVSENPPKGSSFKITANTDDNRHRLIHQHETPYIPAGIDITASVYAKAAEYKWLRLRDNFSNDAYFDLESGSVGDVIDSGTEAGIVSVGGGWYRAYVTCSSNSGGNPIWECSGVPSNTTRNYQGDGSSGIYVAAPMRNVGTKPKPYEAGGPKPQSLAPDVGPSKFAFSVGSDDTAVDTNDPAITPDGVKGDGTDDYLALTAPELNRDRDFTWVVRFRYNLKQDDSNHAILNFGDTHNQWVLQEESNSGHIKLRFEVENSAGAYRLDFGESFNGNSFRTIAFSLDADAQTVRATLDGGSVYQLDISKRFRPDLNGDTLRVHGSASTYTDSEIAEIEHIPRALSGRELRAACRTIGQESQKRNALTRTYPTYAWDFQESADNVLWDTNNLENGAAWTSQVNVTNNAEPRSGKEDWHSLIPTTSDSKQRIFQFTPENGEDATFAVDAKPDGYQWMMLEIYTSDAVWFDLQNGTIGQNDADGASIEALPNGGYRCAVTGVRDGGNVRIYVANGDGVRSFAGDGTSGIKVSRPQVNPGTTAKPYVSKGPKQQQVDSKIGSAPSIQLGSTTGADTNDPTWTAEGLKGDGTDDYATVTDASLNPSSDFSWLIDGVITHYDDGNSYTHFQLGNSTDGLYLVEDIFGNIQLEVAASGDRNALISNQGGVIGGVGYVVIAFSTPDGKTWRHTVNGSPVEKDIISTEFTGGAEGGNIELFSNEGSAAGDTEVRDLHFYDTALGPDALLHETKELLRKRT